jgi:hypothetical protein
MMLSGGLPACSSVVDFERFRAADGGHTAGPDGGAEDGGPTNEDAGDAPDAGLPTDDASAP